MFAPIRPSPTNPICIPVPPVGGSSIVRKRRRARARPPRCSRPRSASARRPPTGRGRRLGPRGGRGRSAGRGPRSTRSLPGPGRRSAGRTQAQLGIGRSAGWSVVSCRNQPVGGRPCGAGWSSGGSAARSQPSWRNRWRRARRARSGDRSVAFRRRGDEGLDREVRAGTAAVEVTALAGQCPLSVGAQAQRRVAVERQAAGGRDRGDGGAAALPWPASRSAGPLLQARRSAGRTGRCRGTRPRSLSRPPSARTRPRGRSGRRRRRGSPGGRRLRRPARARRPGSAAAGEGEADEDAVAHRSGRQGRAARGRPERCPGRACPCSRDHVRPRPERCDLRVGEERQLVASALRQRPDREPQPDAGVELRGRAPAGAEHRPGRREQRVEVEGRSGSPAPARRTSARSSGRRCPKWFRKYSRSMS